MDPHRPRRARKAPPTSSKSTVPPVAFAGDLFAQERVAIYEAMLGEMVVADLRSRAASGRDREYS